MDEEEMKEALNDLIEQFFDGLYESFDLSFGYLPQLYEDEFKKLVEGYASSNTAVNGDVFVDEYVYVIGPFFCEDEESGARKCHVMRKHLILRYHKDVDEFGLPVYLIVGASGKSEDAVEEETVW
jgi:predicted choloylglycine hydrolase